MSHVMASTHKCCTEQLPLSAYGEEVSAPKIQDFIVSCLCAAEPDNCALFFFSPQALRGFQRK